MMKQLYIVILILSIGIQSTAQKTVEDYIEKAEKLETKERYGKAEKVLAKGMKAYENEVRLYIAMANVMFGMEEEERAMEYYNEAIFIAPEDANLYLLRAHWYVRQVFLQFKLEPPCDCDNDLRVASLPKAATTDLNSQSYFRMALEELDQALKIKPNRSDIWLEKAGLHQRLGEDTKVCEAMQQAADLGDKSAIDYLNEHCE